MAELKLPRLNKVLISGRITNDLDLRYTPKGVPVIKFTVAVDRFYKDESGNFQQVTSFLDVVAWNKWAESISSNAHKGSPIIVEGRIEARSYVDSNNNNRKAVEIIAEHVQLLEFQAKGDSPMSSGVENDVPLPDDNISTAQVTNDDVPF